MRLLITIGLAIIAASAHAQPFIGDSGYFGADERRAFEYRHQLAEQQQAYARDQADGVRRRQAYAQSLQLQQARNAQLLAQQQQYNRALLAQQTASQPLVAEGRRRH